ncbi:hypothetical protein KIPB_000079 [Kipferlia bialata]|uniref:Endopeptidase S2P n=1 Tax=Kipferlia bialata TaxID=797122 RepID=A0A9K3CM01_9EUKA|nr:hypothetical protein KIPB_000079 [Kipferlia bialata]|eukprot:g79.t1
MLGILLLPLGAWAVWLCLYHTVRAFDVGNGNVLSSALAQRHLSISWWGFVWEHVTQDLGSVNESSRDHSNDRHPLSKEARKEHTFTRRLLSCVCVLGELTLLCTLPILAVTAYNNAAAIVSPGERGAVGLALPTGNSVLMIYVIIVLVGSVHEMGHFMACRVQGVPVRAIGLNFRYGLVTLYVATHTPISSVPLAQRRSLILSGSTFNTLLCLCVYLCLWIVALGLGDPKGGAMVTNIDPSPYDPRLASSLPLSIQSGDVITSVGGCDVQNVAGYFQCVKELAAIQTGTIPLCPPAEVYDYYTPPHADAQTAYSTARIGGVCVKQSDLGPLHLAHPYSIQQQSIVYPSPETWYALGDVRPDTLEVLAPYSNQNLLDNASNCEDCEVEPYTVSDKILCTSGCHHSQYTCVLPPQTLPSSHTDLSVYAPVTVNGERLIVSTRLQSLLDSVAVTDVFVSKWDMGLVPFKAVQTLELALSVSLGMAVLSLLPFLRQGDGGHYVRYLSEATSSLRVSFAVHLYVSICKVLFGLVVLTVGFANFR